MCDRDISRKELDRIRGEYKEARYSSVEYYNFDTQKNNNIKKSYKEGFFVRTIDGNHAKQIYSNKKKNIDSLLQSTDCNSISKYTPVDPITYYEERSEPLDLPVEIVKNILDTFRNIESVEARMESLTVYEHICTSLGVDVYHGNSKLLVRVFLTPIKGFTIVYSFGYPGQDVTKELERLEDLELSQFSEYHSATSNNFDVVLSPQVTGMIFHEVVHLFEGAIPYTLQFPANVSISDNPKAKKLGGYSFDSEGCKASHCNIVEKGTVQNCLASIFEPGDRAPTGNARASVMTI